MLVTDVLNLALSPFKSAACVVGRRMQVTSTISWWGSTRRKRYTLPLLDYSELSSLYFAIDQATSDDKGYDNPEKVVEIWLGCVIATQYLSDRLLMEIQTVEYHMRFWQHRLKAGNNRVFMAFRRGPLKFARSVGTAVYGLFQRNGTRKMHAADAIEQRIVTLRTMRHMLTALLSRIHAAAAHLAITPELVNSQRDCGRGTTAEKVDGSTARAVAAVADVVAGELLAAAHALGDLQMHLDQQVDGSLSLSVSSKPLLLAPDVLPAVPPEAPAPISDIQDIPLLLSRAEIRLQQTQQYVHGDCLQLESWTGDPVGGAKHASSVARGHRHDLMKIPIFAQAPTRLQRYWLAYTINSVVALFAARWLYNNSPLNGSDNLQKWATKGYFATVHGFRDNVVRPLKNVREEFFETFSSRASYSEFSLKDFEASKHSLQRMLDDFEKDMGQGKGSDEKGMALLLRHYEQELKRPIRNMFSGHLPRSALIQVHKMKTDLEAAMLELDKIMRANELTVAVTAALPAMVIAGALTYVGWCTIMPRPPNVRTAAGPARVALAELEQSIDKARQLENNLGALPRRPNTSAPSLITKAYLTPEASGTSPVRGASPAFADVGPQATTFSAHLDENASINGGLPPHARESEGGLGGVGLSVMKADAHELQHIRGVVLLCTAKLRSAAWQVYSKSTRSLVGAGDSEVWEAEWANLEADLFAIASAGSADQQHRITARMHRSYLAFRS